VRADLHAVLDGMGMLDELGPHRIFREQQVRHSSTQQAIRYAYHHLRSTCATCPRRDAAIHDLPVYFGN
jgi:hypothetical protein